MNAEQQEKLESIQKRIKVLRTFLETTPPGVTSTSLVGMSVGLNRTDAREELKDLEKQEQNLLNPGRSVKNIDLRGAW